LAAALPDPAWGTYSALADLARFKRAYFKGRIERVVGNGRVRGERRGDPQGWFTPHV